MTTEGLLATWAGGGGGGGGGFGLLAAGMVGLTEGVLFRDHIMVA